VPLLSPPDEFWKLFLRAFGSVELDISFVVLGLLKEYTWPIFHFFVILPLSYFIPDGWYEATWVKFGEWVLLTRWGTECTNPGTITWKTSQGLLSVTLRSFSPFLTVCFKNIKNWKMVWWYKMAQEMFKIAAARISKLRHSPQILWRGRGLWSICYSNVIGAENCA